jgi:CelD/BcsL family acetyltransferase involved in cellulose biosynthesis
MKVDTPQVSIQKLTREADLRSLETEWRQLLAKSPANGLFLSWEFVITWWETFSRQCRPHILLARSESGELVGIAPFVICHEQGFPQGVFSKLCLMGDLGGLAPELQDFVVLPGLEQAVGQRFFEEICSDYRLNWDILTFSFIRADSVIMRSLTALNRTVLLRMRSEPAPFIRLPASWEDYEELLGGHFRREVRRKIKKLNTSRQVQIFEPKTEDELSSAMDDLQRLNFARWGEERKSFDSDAWIRFHRAFALQCLRSGWLSLQLLRIDGTTAAALYDFRYENRLWKYQSGWLPEYHQLSPAIYLIANSIETSIRLGLSDVDFLAGGMDYKFDWATDSRDLWSIQGFNRGSAKATMFQVLYGAQQWAQTRLRSLATLLPVRNAADAA